MNGRAIAVLSLAIGLSGCALEAWQGAEWAADLDSLPDESCVRSAVAAVDGVSIADMQHTEKPPLFGHRPPDEYYVFVLSVANPQYPKATMGLHISRERRQSSLSLYSGASAGELRVVEPAARRLIANLLVSCGIPELARRTVESHPSTSHIHLWSPA